MQNSLSNIINKKEKKINELKKTVSIESLIQRTGLPFGRSGFLMLLHLSHEKSLSTHTKWQVCKMDYGSNNRLMSFDSRD